MVFEDNKGEVDEKKLILHANRYNFYMYKKQSFIKGGYYVEVSGSDGNKFLWEGVENNVVYIVIRGFDFNVFDEDEERVVRELLINNPYLLMLMKISNGDWKNQFEMMNMKVDE